MLSAAVMLPEPAPDAEAQVFVSQAVIVVRLSHCLGVPLSLIGCMASWGLTADADLLLGVWMQAQNWCQMMCLNRARLRRRLKRGLDDWRGLYEHAINADMSEGYREHLRASGWKWKALDDEGLDPQVGLG
jgi:hypothetical protein